MLTRKHALLLYRTCSSYSKQLIYSGYSVVAAVERGLTQAKRNELVSDIKDYQRQGAVPWFLLASKYREPVESLQEIYNRSVEQEHLRDQLVQRVTDTAQQHFDKSKGRCNWEAVAKELGMSVVGCLKLYDVDASSIQQRSRPALKDWPNEDRKVMLRFAQKQFGKQYKNFWDLIGIYMNVKYLDCADVGRRLTKHRMTDELFDRITEYRNAGHTWKSICELIDTFHTPANICSGYLYHKQKLENSTGNVDKQSATSGSKLKWKAFLKLTEFAQLQQLVREHGEDWDLIGNKMGYAPSSLKNAFSGYTVDSKITGRWTEEEIQNLRQYIDSGITDVAAARLLGTKIPMQCRWMIQKLQRLAKSSDSSGTIDMKAIQKQRMFTEDDSDELLRLIDLYKSGTVIQWDRVANEIGSSTGRARRRFVKLSKSTEGPAAKANTDKITSIVQKHFQEGSEVDWGLVSKEAGFTELECMENSLYDVGKDSWTYDPKTFSWSMANRMESFIEANYPLPSPPNFRAVSNHMWVKVEDCIKINDLLSGKFRFDQDTIAKVLSLKKQGLRHKDIAKQLSPTLSPTKVGTAIYRHQSKLNASNATLSADDRAEIRMFIDDNIHTMTTSELSLMVRRTFAEQHGGKGSALARAVCDMLRTHPVNKERIERVDHLSIVNQIVGGQRTAKEIARELNVPKILVTNLVSRYRSKQYSQSWTSEETEKLVDYANSSTGQRSWVYFSKALGTKSPFQCQVKYKNMKSAGKLPVSSG